MSPSAPPVRAELGGWIRTTPRVSGVRLAAFSAAKAPSDKPTRYSRRFHQGASARSAATAARTSSTRDCVGACRQPKVERPGPASAEMARRAMPEGASIRGGGDRVGPQGRSWSTITTGARPGLGPTGRWSTAVKPSPSSRCRRSSSDPARAGGPASRVTARARAGARVGTTRMGDSRFRGGSRGRVVTARVGQPGQRAGSAACFSRSARKLAEVRRTGSKKGLPAASRNPWSRPGSSR